MRPEWLGVELMAGFAAGALRGGGGRQGQARQGVFLDSSDSGASTGLTARGKSPTQPESGDSGPVRAGIVSGPSTGRQPCRATRA